MAFPKLLGRPCCAVAIAILALLLVLSARLAWAQDHSMDHDHGGHEGMSMAKDEPTQIDASQQRKILADKKESEFNHHLAGFFVILAGLFVLVQGTLARSGSSFATLGLLAFCFPGCFCSSSATRSSGQSADGVGGTASHIIPRICSTKRLP